MRYSTKTKKRSTRRGRAWAFAALTIVACTSGDTILGAHSFETFSESLSTGVHAHILTGPYAAGRQTVQVVLQAREVDFSSYQGVVEFDDETLGLISVSAPKTDTHFFNREAAANGSLPIAGFAVDGFDEPIRITLSVSASRALRAGDLAVRLDVVATSVGVEIPVAQIHDSNELIQGSASR